MISKVMNYIKNIAWPDKHIMDEIFQINISRVFYLSIVSAVMRLFSIITFLTNHLLHIGMKTYGELEL